jgi:hypothetical protein
VTTRMAEWRMVETGTEGGVSDNENGRMENGRDRQKTERGRREAQISRGHIFQVRPPCSAIHGTDDASAALGLSDVADIPQHLCTLCTTKFRF